MSATETMAGVVLKMDDFRDHLVVVTRKNVHVYPASYFEDWLRDAPVEPMPTEVLKAIVREWLVLVARTQKEYEEEYEQDS